MVEDGMKFETVKELDDEKFRRLAGVKRTTFGKMVLILEQSDKNKKMYGGRKNKLSIQIKTQMPKKRSKKNPLTQEDKRNNRQLSRERVLNENVIGSLKRFKIIADRYRNRRRRFALRINLIAGIYNLELVQVSI